MEKEECFERINLYSIEVERQRKQQEWKNWKICQKLKKNLKMKKKEKLKDNVRMKK